jgi:hypothetical protein
MLNVTLRPGEMHLSGVLDESAEFVLDEQLKLISQDLTINCRDIAQINSFGARVWLVFLQKAAKKFTIKLSECSEVFMSYRSLIPGMSGGCDILSVVVKYECKNCGTVKGVLIEKKDFKLDYEFGTPPCTKCQKSLSASVDPEELFSFLDE